MGRTSTLAKYLIKNYVLNPLIFPIVRSKKLLIPIILFSLFLIALALSAPDEGGNVGLREVIRGMGLSREMVELILGLIISLPLYYSALTLKPLIVGEEAEVEVLLAQPIRMREYMAAKMIANVANSLIFLPAFLGFIPVALELSGSAVKAALSTIMFALTIPYGEALTRFLWNLKLRGKPWRYGINLGTIAFLTVTSVHTYAFHSQAIALPFLAHVKAFVCGFSLSCPLSDMLGYAALATVLTAVFSLLAYLTSDVITPEMVTSLKAKVKAVEVRFSRRERVPYEHLVWPLKGDAIKAALTSAAAALMGYLTREFFRINLEALSPFVGLFITLVAIYTVWGAGEDLVGLWVYRVYMGELSNLGRALILKYSLKMLFPISTISSFLAGMAHSPAPFMTLTAFSSAFVITSFLLMLPVVYFLPRRKVVKWDPLGYYVIDSLVMALVMIPVGLLSMTYFMVTLIAYVSPSWTLTLSALSLGLSLPLWLLLGEVLGNMLYSADLAG